MCGWTLAHAHARSGDRLAIAGYLGPEFEVEASRGHIRDLPQPSELPADMKKGPFGKFAVDVDNGFEAYYVVDADKKKMVGELKRALKDADELYLATDEDREGESISWHLQEVLKWAERNDNQPKSFAQIEPRHVALNQVNAFARFDRECRALGHRAFQHALGKIKPGDPLSGLCQRHGDAPRAAAQLQNGIAEVARGGAIERHVLPPFAHDWRLVVVVRDKRIV